MLNKYFLKQILVIFFLITSFDTNAFFTLIKPVTQKDIIKSNLENDLAFRLGMLETTLVNLNDMKNSLYDKKYPAALGNLSLATLASIATITYPANGNWDVYTKYFGVSKQQILALKLITLASSINACSNQYTKNNPWWSLETGLKTYGCGIPAFKIAWSFRT